MHDKLTRIGVFYDGNYFLHVSNYYNYDHPRKKRLSIAGLHEFIRSQVAQDEDTDVRLCQIVDAHYFRGRLNAQEASQRGNVLYYDRVFDDILMSEGVTTHYLPLRNFGGRREEKGIDVWLALEAFELAIYKKFDVLVLIASDGDYVPLVRKLNTLGTRVMIMSWDFEYTTPTGQMLVTRTSQDLLEEVSYPVPMHEIIDNRLKRNDPVINNLFVQTESKKPPVLFEHSNGEHSDEDYEFDGELHEGEVLSRKNGGGLRKYPPKNFFFHYSTVMGTDFNELREGDHVSFHITKGEKGDYVAVNVRLTEFEEE